MKIRMRKRKKRFCFALCLFLFFLPVLAYSQTYSFIRLKLRNLESFKLVTKDTRIIITPWEKVWHTNGFIAELVSFDDDKWKFLFNEGVPVYDIVFDSHNNAYAGSDTSVYFSPDRGENWSVLPSPKFHRIYEMFWAGDSVLWIADSVRVWRLCLRGYQWQVALEVEGKKSFARTPEGIYLSVKGKGLYFLPWSSVSVPGSWQFTDLKAIFDRSQANNIEDIAYNSKDSTLWVVSFGIPGKKNLAGTFYRKAGGCWYKLTDEGFPDIPVILERFSVVAPDSNGAICFGGCYPRGLYILRPDGSWDWFTDDEGLKNESIFSITVDAQNRKWIAHPYGWVTLMTEYGTGIRDKIVVPNEFCIFQNYPNPFNPSTEIIYELPTSNRVEISIYDINGRLVRKLVDRYEEAGKKSVIWDGRDGSGRRVSSGIYVCRMKFGKGRIKSIKMILRK